MARTRSDSTPTAPPDGKRRNLLLAALPPDDYARIAQHLEVVPLRLRQMLHQPGTPIHHFYFPGDGFCSQLTVMADGRMVEVATVGREGVVGLLGDPGHGTVTLAFTAETSQLFDPSMLFSQRVFQNTSLPLKKARWSPAPRAASTFARWPPDQYSSWPTDRNALCLEGVRIVAPDRSVSTPLI